jgi:hypothetical protein
VSEAIATIGHNQPKTADEIAASIAADLREREGLLLKRTDDLIGAEDRVPEKITTEEQNADVAVYVKQITAAVKSAEASRVNEKEPHMVASRAVDGFYKAVTEPLDRLKRRLGDKMTEYQRAVAQREREAREAVEREQRRVAEEARQRAAEALAAAKTEDDLNAAIAADQTAQIEEIRTVKAERAADKPVSELSRTRSTSGAVATLHTFMDFRALDRDALDLGALREHLPLAALESAVRSFIKAGGRKLDGVIIFENHKTHVR